MTEVYRAPSEQPTDPVLQIINDGTARRVDVERAYVAVQDAYVASGPARAQCLVAAHEQLTAVRASLDDAIALVERELQAASPES